MAHIRVRHRCFSFQSSCSGITFDPVERPGTGNLLTILSARTGEAPAVLAEHYAGSKHGALKKDVVEAVVEAVRKPRAEFGHLREEKTFLVQVTRDGSEKAREHSDKDIERVGLS
jgi:tryptophanyl-tRNA synthetase